MTISPSRRLGLPPSAGFFSAVSGSISTRTPGTARPTLPILREPGTLAVAMGLVSVNPYPS